MGVYFLHILADLWDTALLEKLNSDAKTQQSETRFEVRELADGRKIAWIDDPLTNKQADDFSVVTNKLAEIISSTSRILETGERVKIGQDFLHEYIRSDYTKQILNRQYIRRAKFKIAGSLQDVIAVGTDRKVSNAQYQHASVDYDSVYKYNTLFALPSKGSDGNIVGVKTYSARMIVLHGTNGNLYLYDIIGIKKEKSAAFAARNGLRRPLSR